jgi:hypothetical protein
MFLSSLESIKIIGDFETYYTIQDQALDEKYKKIEDKLEDITVQANAITENLN